MPFLALKTYIPSPAMVQELVARAELTKCVAFQKLATPPDGEEIAIIDGGTTYYYRNGHVYYGMGFYQWMQNWEKRLRK